MSPQARPGAKASTPVPARGAKKGPRPPGKPSPSAKPVNPRRQSAQAAFQSRRKRNRLLTAGSIALVVVVVLVLVIVKVSSGGTKKAVVSTGQSAGTSDPANSPAAGYVVPAPQINKLLSIPLSTLAAASTTGIVTSITKINDAALTSGGGASGTGGNGASSVTGAAKPELLFIGAEFCPICATERWPMFIALSKFGTFSPNPGRIHSAVRDSDIQTLTFYGTTYSSPYFVFTPVETTTNQPDGNYYVTLQTPTAAQQQIWKAHTSQTFPFVDFAGHAILTSAQFQPTELTNQTFDDIVSQAGDNGTTIGRDIDASAYLLIKQICTMTGDKPASVCSAG